MNPVGATPNVARAEGTRDAAAPSADLMSLFAALFATAAANPQPTAPPPAVPDAAVVLPDAVPEGAAADVPCVEMEMPLPAPGGWPGASVSSPPAIPAMTAQGRARPVPTPARPAAADLHSAMAGLPNSADAAGTPEAPLTAEPPLARDGREVLQALEGQRVTPEFRAALRALGAESPAAPPTVTPQAANPAPAPAPPAPAPAPDAATPDPRVRTVRAGAAVTVNATAAATGEPRVGERSAETPRFGARGRDRAGSGDPARTRERGHDPAAAPADAVPAAAAPVPVPEAAAALPDPAVRAAAPAPPATIHEASAPAAAAVSAPPELPAEPPAPWIRTHATVAFDSGEGQEGRLRVSLRGNELHATLQMPDVPAAQRMEQDLAELSRALRVQGFEDARVAVDAPRAAGSADRSQDQPLPRESRHPREGHAQGGERQARRERGSAREER